MAPSRRARRTAHGLGRPGQAVAQRAWLVARRSPEQVGADPAQISRYENGRITPSADALVRLAETFDVSCDYLLLDDVPRRPFRSPEDGLSEGLAGLNELGERDRELVLSFIDALVTKTRLKALAGGVS